MKFGPVPLEEGEGAILAHSVHVQKAQQAGVQSGRISKGTVLSAAHIAALRASGVSVITVARLEPGDVHEDAAALRLAEALAGGAEGLEISAAATGRVNVRATRAGLVTLDVAAIHALNRINPGITVATVPEWQRLEPRGLAATIKIIPYAVADRDLSAACDLGEGAMGYALPRLATATLIETQVGQDVPSEKGRRAIEARLDRLGVALSDRVLVPHETAAVAAALKAAPGALKLILTGSATSDAADTAPEAVRAAGGDVIHYGMPVDPGNLLFLGKVGGAHVIGLPGCARSPALNGADWVLERVICAVPVTPDVIAGLGVGGLLKEIPSRPMPRGRIDAGESGD